jgi:anti-sigma factor RsiW
MTEQEPNLITDELLSAYIDNAVTDQERAIVDAALATDPQVRWRLAALRHTVQLLNELPMVALPRSFTLKESQVADVLATRKASVAQPQVVQLTAAPRPIRQPDRSNRWSDLLAQWRDIWASGNPYLRNAAAATLVLFLLITGTVTLDRAASMPATAELAVSTAGSQEDAAPVAMAPRTPAEAGVTASEAVALTPAMKEVAIEDMAVEESAQEETPQAGIGIAEVANTEAEVVAAARTGDLPAEIPVATLSPEDNALAIQSTEAMADEPAPAAVAQDQDVARAAAMPEAAAASSPSAAQTDPSPRFEPNARAGVDFVPAPPPGMGSARPDMGGGYGGGNGAAGEGGSMGITGYDDPYAMPMYPGTTPTLYDPITGEPVNGEEPHTDAVALAPGTVIASSVITGTIESEAAAPAPSVTEPAAEELATSDDPALFAEAVTEDAVTEDASTEDEATEDAATETAPAVAETAGAEKSAAQDGEAVAMVATATAAVQMAEPEPQAQEAATAAVDASSPTALPNLLRLFQYSLGLLAVTFIALWWRTRTDASGPDARKADSRDNA